jgi:hypothetical protein
VLLYTLLTPLGHFGGFSFVLAKCFVISGVSSLLVPPMLDESFRTVPGSFVFPVLFISRFPGT